MPPPARASSRRARHAGRRGRGRGRLVAAQQQHVATAIELRGRHHVRREEGAAVVGAQDAQHPDREAGREPSAQAGGEQHVALAHIRGQGDVGGPQQVAAPTAMDHHPGATAGGHRGDSVVGIGDQQDGGGGRRGVDHLPHQATGIDHRLPHLHAVALAGVQHQPLPGGIQVDVEDAGQLHVEAIAFHPAEQRAQADVLHRRRLQACIAGASDQQGVAQDPVLPRQLAAQRGVLAHRHADPRRQLGQPPHGLHRDFGACPRGCQPTATVVQHHHHQRQHQVDQQPQHAGDIAGAGSGRTGEGRHVSGSADGESGGVVEEAPENRRERWRIVAARSAGTAVYV